MKNFKEYIVEEYEVYLDMPHKKKYILIAPWSTKVLNQFRPKLADYKVNKKTIAVPNDWKVDEKLLQQMVKARLAE